VAEVVDDPQFAARGAFTEAVHPTEGRFRQVAPTLAGTVRPEGAVAVPDVASTDTDELLAAAGVGPERCAQLRAAGVVA
jgi:alpha-methylacyl-CoA racemase